MPIGTRFGIPRSNADYHFFAKQPLIETLNPDSVATKGIGRTLLNSVKQEKAAVKAQNDLIPAGTAGFYNGKPLDVKQFGELLKNSIWSNMGKGLLPLALGFTGAGIYKALSSPATTGGLQSIADPSNAAWLATAGDAVPIGVNGAVAGIPGAALAADGSVLVPAGSAAATAAAASGAAAEGASTMGGLLGPILGAVGNLAGGFLGAKASENAADAIAKANSKAIDVQKKMYEEAQKRLSPYNEAGKTALGNLQALLSGDFDITKNPAYNFDLQQGLDALEQSAAARGGVLSGPTAKALTRYAEGYASNEFNNIYNRLASIISIGENAAANSGNVGMNAGNNISNIIQNTGNAAGNAIVGGANSWINALNGIAQGIGYGGLFGNG